MNKLYFRFIRFSLGIDEGKDFLDGSALKGFDWQAFYEFVNEQTLLGIIMDGVQRLPKEVTPRKDLLLRSAVRCCWLTFCKEATSAIMRRIAVVL